MQPKEFGSGTLGRDKYYRRARQSTARGEPAVSILATLLGATIIAVTLRDIFQQVFSPGGGGSLSRTLMHLVWGGFRRMAAGRHTLLALAGPLALLAIIASWLALLAVGWALIYWPRLPEEFLLQTGLSSADNGGFIDALYLSLVTLATLGYGDIVPTNEWMRIIAPLQALTGFSLLTAALSLILSLYPVFARRQSLAQEVSLIRESENEGGSIFKGMSADAAERMLSALTAQLITVQGDLVRFPITYYFHNSVQRIALPAVMPYLLNLAQRAGDTDHPLQVRRAAGILLGSIDDLSATLQTSFLDLSSASTEKVLEAYAQDHFYAPPQEDRK